MLESVRRANTLLAMMAAAIVLLVVAGVLFVKPAHAATFTVNSTNHPGTEVCDANECTLREAIDAANTNGESDTIEFAPWPSGDIELSAGAGGFLIQNDSPEEDLTIDGPGAGVLAVDGNGQTRVFEIAIGAKATIKGLTIKNGQAIDGGGISNGGGTLTVTNSTISGNSDGGIFNRNSDGSGATLTVKDSTISGNSGSGIYNYNSHGWGATLTVKDSTISGNSVSFGYGGGIINAYGTATVTNSTISGNSSLAGGGIFSEGPLTVTNSTISGNSSNEYGGGGIYNRVGTATLANTILAGNSANNGPDAYGPFNSQGYNLIGNTGDSSGWVDSDLLNQDPLLKPLALNAPGSTQTHALKANSPVINAIPVETNGCSTTITHDQTGTIRPQGEGCDIGSYENKSPRVKGVSPKEGATGVAPRTKVRALFSQGVQSDTVTVDTFKLYKVEGEATTEVAVQVSYDAAKKVGILTPSAVLERGATYRAVVSTEVRDLAGNRLDQDRDPTNGNQQKAWTFTVAN